MISFGDTFNKVRECFTKPDIEAGLTPKLASVTIIRDVYGKIRLFLEPNANAQVKETEINKLKQHLQQELSSYYGEDIWLPQGEKDGYKALIDTIKDEKIEAEWDDVDISPRWYVLERHLAKQTWTNQNSGNPPWEIEEVDSGDKPQH